MTERQDNVVIGPGKVAVITGAGSGIGRALAEAFAAAGSAVVVADLDEGEAEVVSQGIQAGGGVALAVKVDVSDAAAVDRLAATTLERFGRVDVLCNNAGVSTFNLISDQTLDDWRWVVGVNFWGVVHGVHTFVPIMRDQGTPATHCQYRFDSGTSQRRRLHRAILRHQGGGGVDLRDPGSGAGARPDTHWRECPLSELGRHQGDGVRTRASGRRWVSSTERRWRNRCAS